MIFADRGLLQSRERIVIIIIIILKKNVKHVKGNSNFITKSIQTQKSPIINITTKPTKSTMPGLGKRDLIITTITDDTIKSKTVNEHNAGLGLTQSSGNICVNISKSIIGSIGRNTITGALGILVVS